MSVVIRVTLNFNWKCVFPKKKLTEHIVFYFIKKPQLSFMPKVYRD